MIGVAAFIFAWVCAASIDTAWQFGVNTLSEFGISDTDASLYFNYGCCMITGAFIVAFGIGRAACAKNKGHAAGGTLLAVGGVFLALVGWFTMDAWDTHRLVAVSMAALMFFGIVAVSAGNWAADRKVFAGVGVIVAFMLATMSIAFDVAELEAYGIILAMIWLLSESVNMILCRKN
jgi:hypothetical membrane protein